MVISYNWYCIPIKLGGIFAGPWVAGPPGPNPSAQRSGPAQSLHWKHGWSRWARCVRWHEHGQNMEKLGDSMELYRIIWNYMVLYGIIWYYMELDRIRWLVAWRVLRSVSFDLSMPWGRGQPGSPFPRKMTTYFGWWKRCKRQGFLQNFRAFKICPIVYGFPTGNGDRKERLEDDFPDLNIAMFWKFQDWNPPTKTWWSQQGTVAPLAFQEGTTCWTCKS